MPTVDLDARDGMRLKTRFWRTEDRPKAVVQIAHGAAEHLGRYDRLASELTDAGYAAIGADHRGHGVNSGLHGFRELGPNGFQGVVEDMLVVSEQARERWPATPLVLLGHSFGSFAAQRYLVDNPGMLDGLVLSGTAALEVLLTQPEFSGNLEACNAAFEPARTKFDWLSRDEAEVDAYVADPQCGTDIAPESLATMGEAFADIRQHPGAAAAAARGIPIYVISGEVDPIVGPGQCLAQAVVDSYLGNGFSDVTHRIYPGGRHEMFNEINRNEVTADLITWLDAQFA